VIELIERDARPFAVERLLLLVATPIDFTNALDLLALVAGTPDATSAFDALAEAAADPFSGFAIACAALACCAGDSPSN
jgi:hypothetical protein